MFLLETLLTTCEITKGRKEDYQRKEGSQPRELRKMTMGGMITNERKEVNQGKEGSHPREGRKMTMRRMKDFKGKEGT